MSLFRHFIASIILLLFISNVTYATSQEASSFVSDLANRVINVLKEENSSAKSKEIRLNDLFLTAVDTQWIAKFAMGRYWRSITPAQQETYTNMFSQYLVNIYVPNFKKYTGNIIKVTGVTKTNKNGYIVHTQLTDTLHTINIKIDYNLVQKENEIEQFVIFDIIAEGVSLITTQRAEINSIMSSRGFNSLIKLLKQKT